MAVNNIENTENNFSNFMDPMSSAPPPKDVAGGGSGSGISNGSVLNHLAARTAAPTNEEEDAVAQKHHKHHVSGSPTIPEDGALAGSSSSTSVSGSVTAPVDTIESAIGTSTDATSKSVQGSDTDTDSPTMQSVNQFSLVLANLLDENYFKAEGKSKNDAPPPTGGMPSPANVNVGGFEKSAWFDAQGLTAVAIAYLSIIQALQKARQVDIIMSIHQAKNTMELAKAEAAADIRTGELQQEQYMNMAMADICGIAMSAMSIGMTLKSGGSAKNMLKKEESDCVAPLQAKYAADRNTDGTKGFYSDKTITKKDLENEEFINKLGVQSPDADKQKSKAILKQEQVLQDFIRTKPQRLEALRTQQMQTWNAVAQMGGQMSSTAKEFIQAYYAMPLAEQEAAKAIIRGLSQSQNTVAQATEADEKSLQDTINTIIQNLSKVYETLASMKTI